MTSRITALRSRLAGTGCEAFLSFAPATNQWLSGFRGSTSAVIVTESDAVFLNDFRYTEQAA
ncbi:MAG TPA: aminopeptidase P family N-terminal domain-containing protein, partial [Candidatus Hydrogenedentes bacterium]|nr:aminopeptidase P family N-terminal domain-containing protein [Candidatus Hydrogenedentota bacterium]